MSFFNLKLYKRSETLLILTIPLFSRIVILLLTIVLGSTFLINPEFALIPIILMIILVLSSCYKELWIFNALKKEIFYGFGLQFFYHKKRIPFDKIENFKIESYIKGSMTKKPDDESEAKKKFYEIDFYKLILVHKEQGEITMHTVKGKKKVILTQYAKDISTLCNVQLIYA